MFTVAYLLYFRLSTGDWLYRYHLLQSNNAIADETYAEQPSTDLWQRIGYELWKVFLYNGDMEYLLFAIAGLFYYKSVFKEARVRHIAWSFLCCCFVAISCLYV